MTSYLHIDVILFIIVWFCLLVGPPAILTWAIRRWLRTSPRIAVPAWRSYLAIVAVILVALSELLWIVSAAWANASGGIPVSSIFIWFARLGFFAALAGLLASSFAKGTLRSPTSIAAATTLLWIAMGSSDS